MGLAGGFVSHTSLWKSSTDFHTHCETATKLNEELDGDGMERCFLTGFLLSASPSYLLSLCFSYILPICFSLAAN